MNRVPRLWKIRVEGRLHERWREWFDGMAVINLEQGETCFQGILQDQSALVGIINRIHDLNLALISVEGVRIEDSEIES